MMRRYELQLATTKRVERMVEDGSPHFLITQQMALFPRRMRLVGRLHSFVRRLDVRASSLSWLRLMRILLGVVLVFQFSATLCFHEAMYSPLNRNFARKKQWTHDQALRQAQQFINNRKIPNTLPHVFNDASFDSASVFSVVIITTQRKRPYLDILLWSLLEGNNSHQNHNLTAIPLSIVNAQRPPSDHVDLPKWKQLLPDVRFLNATKPSMSYTWQVQEVLDYRDALRECQRQGKDWCIVLEEDIMATRNFFNKFEKVVPRVIHDTQQVGMVKLFLTDYYDGFSTDWKHAQDIAWMSLASFFGMVLLFSLLPTKRRPTPSHTFRQVRYKQIVAFLVIFAAFMELVASRDAKRWSIISGSRHVFMSTGLIGILPVRQALPSPKLIYPIYSLFWILD